MHGFTGTSTDPRGPRSIAAKVTAMPCYEVVAATWTLPFTDVPGTLPEGGQCWSDMQCSSGWCDVLPLDVCGACGVPPSVDEYLDQPCTVYEGKDVTGFHCGSPELWCEQATLTCRRRPRAGDPCIDNRPAYPEFDCADTGLTCHDGICVEPLDFGEACDPANDLCNPDAGATCGADGTCAIVGPAHLEGECGPFSQGDGYCGWDDICTYIDPTGNNDEPGYCAPDPKTGFGDPCSAEDPFKQCPLTLDCINGTCQTPPWIGKCD
jgi:hypothetical protein